MPGLRPLEFEGFPPEIRLSLKIYRLLLVKYNRLKRLERSAAHSIVAYLATVSATVSATASRTRSQATKMSSSTRRAGILRMARKSAVRVKAAAQTEEAPMSHPAARKVLMWEFQGGEWSKYHPNILRTNKNIHDEAAAVLYGMYIFRAFRCSRDSVS